MPHRRCFSCSLSWSLLEIGHNVQSLSKLQFLVCCLGVLFMGRLCAGAALCQPTQLLEEFPLLRRFIRAVRTLKTGHFSFAFASFSPGPVFGCCLWSTASFGYSGRSCVLATWINSGLMFYREALDDFFTFSTLR